LKLETYFALIFSATLDKSVMKIKINTNLLILKIFLNQNKGGVGWFEAVSRSNTARTYA
jgi:hypothetical protein